MAGDDWNPALYTRFERERTQPARDLLSRCAFPEAPRGRGLRIADLGCGPGNSTELLVERFSEAEVIGFDTSDAMLEAARRRVPAARFEPGDIGAFAPPEPFDLIYSNAALQWVRGHERLLPALLRCVKPGGLLAAQIPLNLAEPSQTAMVRIAAEPAFAGRLGAAGDVREPDAPLARYYDWLVGAGAEVETWLTRYEHVMADPRAIVDWFRSTGLRPFLDPLDEAGRAAFLSRYEAVMAEAYSPRADGKRLLGFPRLFFVARKRG